VNNEEHEQKKTGQKKKGAADSAPEHFHAKFGRDKAV
jgi:hypothetical protein